MRMLACRPLFDDTPWTMTEPAPSPDRPRSARRLFLLSTALLLLTVSAIVVRQLPASDQRKLAVLPVILAYDRFANTCQGSELERPRRHWFVGQLGGPEKALPLLAFYAQLPASSTEARDAAVLLISSCGSNAVPFLLATLKSNEAGMRAAAAEGLGLVDAPAKDTLPWLQDALGDEAAHVRSSAARGLCLLKTDAAPALEALKARLTDSNRGTRYWAVRAINALGPRRAEALKKLIPLVDDDSPDVRRAAAVTLGAIGPRAIPAIPALKRLLKDLDIPAREAATEAIKKIRP